MNQKYFMILMRENSHFLLLKLFTFIHSSFLHLFVTHFFLGTRMCQGGGYGGGLYMLNETELTTICTNVRFNEAGDSGGGVMLQKGSHFVSLSSQIMNNSAKLNIYYDRNEPTKRVKEFYRGIDIRYYQQCTIRSLKNSRIEESKVYPYIDVKKDIYLEMYYSHSISIHSMNQCFLLMVWSALFILWN